MSIVILWATVIVGLWAACIAGPWAYATVGQRAAYVVSQWATGTVGPKYNQIGHKLPNNAEMVLVPGVQPMWPLHCSHIHAQSFFTNRCLATITLYPDSSKKIFISINPSVHYVFVCSSLN